MTKAVRVHKVGGPEALVYESVDVPAPGPGEVRIRQHREQRRREQVVRELEHRDLIRHVLDDEQRAPDEQRHALSSSGL